VRMSCGWYEDQLRAVDKIVIIALRHVPMPAWSAKYAIEHWTRIPCEVERLTSPSPRPGGHERTSSSRSRSRETMDP